MDFVAHGPPLRARKSVVQPGLWRGQPAISKRPRDDSPVWRWYFARELAIYRAFDATPPPFHVPRLFHASDDALVIEHIEGAPLATRRLPAAHLDLDPLLDTLDSVRTWTATATATATSPPLGLRLRPHMLEDPTAPRAWVTDGIRLSVTRGYLEPADADRLIATLPANLELAHGDLLLRNVISLPPKTEDRRPKIILLDWECAGPYLAGWDRALLWTQLDDASRTRLDVSVPLAAFALCREIHFKRAFRGKTAGLRAAVRELLKQIP